MSDINYIFEAVKLMYVIEELKEQSKNGIRSFDEYTSDVENGKDYIWFDPDSNVYGSNKYEIVSLSCVDENHHDIISTMTNHFDNIDIFVQRGVGDDGDDENLSSDYYVGIRCRETDELIIIENGYSYISY